MNETSIISTGTNKHFPIDNETDLVHLVTDEGGDLAGLDARYSLGNHSCNYFCIFCQTDDKTKLAKDGAAYRTRQNINLNAVIYANATSTGETKRTPLQTSCGVA